MTYITEDYIQDAIDQVSAWGISDDEFADAVNGQARLMAGLTPEPHDAFVLIAVQSHARS